MKVRKALSETIGHCLHVIPPDTAFRLVSKYSCYFAHVVHCSYPSHPFFIIPCCYTIAISAVTTWITRQSNLKHANRCYLSCNEPFTNNGAYRQEEEVHYPVSLWHWVVAAEDTACCDSGNLPRPDGCFNNTLQQTVLSHNPKNVNFEKPRHACLNCNRAVN